MIDFHVHIGASAADMLAAEALCHAAAAGYRAVGLVLRASGHAGERWDAAAALIRQLSLYSGVEAFWGVELVHVPPAMLPDMVQRVREAGAELVLVHGETLADQVAVGTNLAAVEAGADILAHPGLVDEQVAEYAAQKGVALELSSCPAHAIANAHVARMAERYGCALVRGSDATTPQRFTTRREWDQICRGAAMSSDLRRKLEEDSRALAHKLINRKKAEA